MDNCFRYEYFSSVKKKPVEWLWYPYIPYGKITVLQGDPGEGKSTFILNVAALLTKGLPMPDGFQTSCPQTVVYQCAEDNVADTIKPRLMSANADCDRIAYIIDEGTPLTLDDARIEHTLKETGARLLVLDPIQAFLPQDGDMQSASRMRTILGKLSILATTYQCAIVLIGHMNKSSGGKNLYRGLGTIDIAATARSVLMIARDKSDPMLRYMVPVKSSLAPEGPAIGFILGGGNGFQWVGPCEAVIDRTDAVETAPDTKSEEAANYLIDRLSARDVLSSELISELTALGISRRTVFSAKKDVGIQAYRKEAAWYWRIPKNMEEKCSRSRIDCQNTKARRQP